MFIKVKGKIEHLVNTDNILRVSYFGDKTHMYLREWDYEEGFGNNAHIEVKEPSREVLEEILRSVK